jgi:DNA-binding NarL/FixJ family response regulator
MKIVIADDYGILRQGLKSLIEKQDELEVIGEAADGSQVVEVARKLKPDLVIMDISMPNMNGIEATKEILSQNPKVKIIALSMHSNKRFVSEMLKAGAMGYVLKSYLFDELVRAINAADKGERYLSPRITNVLVEDYVGETSAETNNYEKIKSLTDRERIIIQLLTEGHNIKEIALKLNVSPKTADANRRALMKKLDLSSLAELTKFAIKEGLTSLDF